MISKILNFMYVIFEMLHCWPSVGYVFILYNSTFTLL